ncbi:T9SS type A sorting domain-containing protein [Puteibacter caeruleilacunae]|nr:T9SS type A sorting domain-containing protein [Puteibacter caeruleilacunae]
MSIEVRGKTPALLIWFFTISILPVSGQTIVNSDGLRFKFGKPGEEVLVNSGATLSMGNFGPNSSIITFNLIIENTSNESIEIKNAQITKPHSKINTYLPSEINLAPLQHTTLGFLFHADGSIATERNGITFETNKSGYENIQFNFVVNPDKGKLKFSSDVLEANNIINLGNVKLNEFKNFTIGMTNIGKGYLKLGRAKDIITNNQLELDYNSEHVISPQTTYNNNGTFKALKKGPITASYSHDVIRGEVDTHTFQVTGKVIAPVAQLSYNSQEIINNSEIDLQLELNTMFEAVFTVTNTGDDELSLHRITIEGQGENEISVMQGSTATVQPGNNHQVKINIIPRKIENRKLKLSFLTDGYESETIAAYVNLNIGGPSIALTDEAGNTFDFNTKNQLGICENGQAFTRKILLSNNGTKELVLGKTEITGYSQNNLTIKNQLPASIAAGESFEMEMQYISVTPRRASEEYVVRIQSNALNHSNFICNLLVQNHFAAIDIKANDSPIANNGLLKLETTSVNTPRLQEFTIKNQGTVALNIGNIQFTEDELNYFSVSQSPDNNTLQPGEVAIFQTTFAPKLEKYDYSGKLQITTNDYLNPSYSFSMKGDAHKPELQLWNAEFTNLITNNETLDYGGISYPDKRIREYIIKNSSMGQLKINDLKIETSEGVKAELVGQTDYVVESGAIKRFTLKYQCFQKGEQTVNISFNTNDYNCPKFKYAVRFASLVPDIELYASEKLINNSKVKFEDSDQMTFRIKNTGTDPLDLTSVEIEGADKDVFTVNVTDRFVREGEELPFTVKLTATENGTYNARLVLTTNDVEEPVFSLGLEAEKSIHTSIDEIESNRQPSVYPNPFRDHLTVKNTEYKEYQISIYQITGRKVYSTITRAKEYTIPMQVPQGIYIIQIKSGSNIWTQKIIKG